MADFFWFSDSKMGSDQAAFADGCARQEAGGRPPGAERDRPRAQMRRALGGLRRCYGPKKTLYNRFVRWAERGIWEDIFSALAGTQDTPDRLFIDSSCIKVHRCAGGGKGGPWLMVSAAPKAAAHQAPCRLR
jgi:transposase